MKRTIAMLLAAVLVLGMIPFVGAAVAVTGIQTAGMTKIRVGQTVKWTASVLPANATDKFLWWTAGNPGVATVDQSGVITGKRAGQCNITITAKNGVKKTLLLTVGDIPVTGIQTAGKTKLTVGEKVKWTASVLPANATDKYLWWTAGNPGVATVDQNGNITAKRAGKCNITVAAKNGVKKTVLVTVTAKNVSAELFKKLAGKDFCFYSGVGAWSSGITMNADGSFTGAFTDVDAGVETVYTSDFSGKFTNVRKISDYEYAMQLNGLTYKVRPGKEWFVDDFGDAPFKFIAATAYGLDELGEFRVYLKGCRTSVVPTACLAWCGMLADGDPPATMPYDVIYCVKGEHTFRGSESTPEE